MLTKKQQNILDNHHGEQTWSTSTGEVFFIKNMHTTHLRNTIKYIERKKEKELEITMPKELSLNMQISSLKQTIENLENINSPGTHLAYQCLEHVQEQINRGFTVSQTLLQKHLSIDLKYLCLTKELQLRENQNPSNIELPDNPFLQKKMTTTIVEIIHNPKNIPMNLVVESQIQEQKNMKVGDMIFHPENDNFRITYLLHINNLTHITLNARTKNEKEIVLKHIKLYDEIDVY